MARILLVDDQKSILVMLEGILQSQGHAVTCATNPIDALDKLNTLPFDLLITDAIMPGGVSGFALIRTVRSNEKLFALPIIMLSGRREKHDIEKGIQVGADDYIVKPIDPDLFLTRVNSMLKVKAPGSLTFVERPLRETFQWEVLNEIVAVSEVGLTLHCALAADIGAKLKIKSKFLEEMGFPSIYIRVVSCEKAKGDLGYYIIKSHYIGLTEASLQPLRLWIRNQKTA